MDKGQSEVNPVSHWLPKAKNLPVSDSGKRRCCNFIEYPGGRFHSWLQGMVNNNNNLKTTIK